jgi:hypothetical protein
MISQLTAGPALKVPVKSCVEQMNKDFSFNLGHLTISIRLYANDYTDGSIAVFQCAKLCGARDLTAGQDIKGQVYILHKM